MNKKATATATQGHSRDGHRTTVAALPRNLKWSVATSLHKKSIIQYSECHFLVNRVGDLFREGSGRSHATATPRPQAAARTTAAAPPKNLKWRVATSLHKMSTIQYSKCHFVVNRVRDLGEGSGHGHSQPQPNMARELPASCHRQLPAD